MIGLVDGGATVDGASSLPDGTTGGGDGTVARRDGGPGCVPRTCVSLGAECGTIDDGCGATPSCGPCDGDLVCGAGGVPNVCAAVPACGAAPAGSNADQIAALEIVNELRLDLGVPCLTMIPEINQASQAHADYGNTNAGDSSCRSSGHDETEGCPGYTGRSFGQRLSAAGYSGARTEIAHFLSSPDAAVSGWLGTLWHSIPILHPNSDDFGYGGAPGWNVMDFGRTQAADVDGVWFYPLDGSSVSGTGGNEIPAPPDPPSGCPTWGTFVRILFDRSASVTIDTHELTGPSGSETHEWITPSDSAFLFGSVYVMVPCPLSAGVHTVRVAGTLNGTAFDRSSTFTVR